MSIKISELTSGTTLDGTEVLPIVQDGATVKITTQDVADLASSSGAVWGGITGDITDQTDLVTALNLKVDAVPGKGLSANDFTNTLKTKLDGIEDGAQVNVNADWNATSGDAQILNKPTIPSIAGLATETFVTNITDNKVDKVTGSRLITSAESTVLGNTSGTNTGDQDLSGLLEKSGGSLTGQLMYATPVTLASASTVNLASAGSNIVYISGTTNITSFGTSAETNLIYVKFLGALTLTNNASFILLPGFANITTAANDEAVMLNLGGGLWKCISYNPFSVTGLGAQVRQASPTLTGNPTLGNSTSNSTTGLASGATTTGNTKTVNIGTAGLSGSTTNINIGSAVSGSTTTTTINGKLVANNISGFLIKKLGASGTIATTTESIIGNVEILGGTLASTDRLNITSRVRKGGNNNTYLLRYYLNTTSGSLTGATQIAISATQSLGSIISAEFSREFIIDGGNLMGFPFATASTDGITSSSSVGTVAYNVATTYYIITTVTLASALDTASLIGQKITNL